MEVSSLNQLKKDYNLEIGVGAIITNAFKIGFQNWGNIILAILLFIITFWIPYLNIGAYLGLSGFIVTMSKGKKINATDMFNSYYLKKIGDIALLYFLFYGGFLGLAMILWEFGSYIALFTGVVPLIVIYYSWYVSSFLILDKDLGALKVLEISNRITYGYKGTIFGAHILMGIIFFSVTLFGSGVIYGIGSMIYIGSVEYVIIMICFIIIAIAVVSFLISIFFGMEAYIYRVLEKRISLVSHSQYFHQLNPSLEDRIENIQEL